MRTDLIRYARYPALTISAMFLGLARAVAAGPGSLGVGDLEFEMNETVVSPAHELTLARKGRMTLAVVPEGVEASGPRALTYHSKSATCVARKRRSVPAPRL